MEKTIYNVWFTLATKKARKRMEKGLRGLWKDRQIDGWGLDTKTNEFFVEFYPGQLFTIFTAKLKDRGIPYQMIETGEF